MDDYVPETDIIDLLSFDENQLEDLFQNHSAIQARWEQLAINARNDYETFEEEFLKKWWANNKQFARLALLTTGAKNLTIDSIRDTTILIYSRDTTDIIRDKYAEWAFNGAVKEKSVYLTESKTDFRQSMFRYLTGDVQWFYEDLVRVVKEKEKLFLTLQNISKRLDSRSFHMKELADLVRAKASNIGPMSYKDRVQEKDLERAIAEGKLVR